MSFYLWLPLPHPTSTQCILSTSPTSFYLTRTPLQPSTSYQLLQHLLFLPAPTFNPAHPNNFSNGRLQMLFDMRGQPRCSQHWEIPWWCKPSIFDMSNVNIFLEFSYHEYIIISTLGKISVSILFLRILCAITHYPRPHDHQHTANCCDRVAYRCDHITNCYYI